MSWKNVPRRGNQKAEPASRDAAFAPAPALARAPTIALALALAAPCALAACGDNTAPVRLDKAALMDPATCQSCHPQQFEDWSGSMHAYAGDDPVFVAMNQRAQRETNGALGDFCVKCHAPVALAEGLTSDGTNLSALPASVRGVTCYFCHSAAAVEGTHNNPLKLASDGTLFGPFADPAPGTPHRAAYSPLFDLARAESAAACGSCHDIVNRHGAAVERTFAEWQSTLFSDTKVGQTCVRCHMNQSRGPASTISPGTVRSLGSHLLPGVDVALTPFPGRAAQRQAVQSQLDSTLSGTLCLSDDLRISVTLDNVAAGHSVPSGSTPDRRLWAEVIAYSGADAANQRVLYQSGVQPPGVSEAARAADPDAWLIRDCLFDPADNPTPMFWNAARAVNNAIPGAVKATLADPGSFTRSHLKYIYPARGALPERPDRITLRVFIKPIGDDVLEELVASGDLAPEIAHDVPTFVFAQTDLEWTAAKGRQPLDSQTRAKVAGLSCVSTSAQYLTLPTVAISHARCVP